MLERTDVITNEVLEPITVFLAYRTVYARACVCVCVHACVRHTVIKLNESAWKERTEKGKHNRHCAVIRSSVCT